MIKVEVSSFICCSYRSFLIPDSHYTLGKVSVPSPEKVGFAAKQLMGKTMELLLAVDPHRPVSRHHFGEVYLSASVIRSRGFWDLGIVS